MNCDRESKTVDCNLARLLPFLTVNLSFQFRTTKLSLGQWCDLNGERGIVGDVLYGIPVNIQIKGGLLMDFVVYIIQ